MKWPIAKPWPKHKAWPAPSAPSTALFFDGTDDYLTEAEEPDPKYRLTQYTVDAWIWPDLFGRNVIDTGTLMAIPIVGRGGDRVNYLLSLVKATSKLKFVYSDAANVSRILFGTKTLSRQTWTHVGITADATMVRMYVGGVLDATFAMAGNPPAATGVGPLWIGAYFITEVRGAFHGYIQNVRIWNRALSATEILASAKKSGTMFGTPGLVDEFPLVQNRFRSVGITVPDSSIPGYTEVPEEEHLSRSGIVLSQGGFAQFEQVVPPYRCDEPGTPVLSSPADFASVAGPVVTVQAAITDADGNANTVEIFGRRWKSAPDFCVMTLPDTQEQVSGDPVALQNGFQWIVDSAVSLNTKVVAALGDCVDHNIVSEWDVYDAAYTSTIEAAGIPYIWNIGNHDNGGDPDGTALPNTYFGPSRFAGEPWYLGHHGTDNDNCAVRVQVSTDPSLYVTIISWEYDKFVIHPEVADWIRGIAQTYPNDIVMVVCHWLLGAGTPGIAVSAQWELLYEKVNDLPQVKLLMCGHFSQSHRVDRRGPNPLYTIMADYQFQTARFVARPVFFRPRDGVMYHRSYDVAQAAYRSNSEDEFSLPFAFPGEPPFELVGTVYGVAAGATASFNWSGLTAGNYEWFARSRNGPVTRDSARRSFTVT